MWVYALAVAASRALEFGAQSSGVQGGLGLWGFRSFLRFRKQSYPCKPTMGYEGGLGFGDEGSGIGFEGLGILMVTTLDPKPCNCVISKTCRTEP